jgi:hypothetical protein
VSEEVCTAKVIIYLGLKESVGMLSEMAYSIILGFCFNNHFEIVIHRGNVTALYDTANRVIAGFSAFG